MKRIASFSWNSGPSFYLDLAELAARFPHWLILLLIAVPTRLITLGSESLWFDESFTWLVAKQDTRFWQAVLGDDHPPLWSMVQWLNMRLLGGSEFAFRFPAMICSLICVLLIWRIALKLVDRKTALIAGVIAALLPASIYFGQDGRMYAALAMFLLLAVWGALRCNWIMLYIGSVGAIYTQNAGLFYVAALGIVILIMSIYADWMTKKIRFVVAPAITFLLIALSWLPWLGSFLMQAQRVKASFWVAPMTPVNVFWPFVLDTMFIRAPDLVQINLYAFALSMSLLALYLSKRWLKKNSKAVIVLCVMLGGPMLLATACLVWGRNVYVYKPMLASGLLLSIFWAWPLVHLSWFNRRTLQFALCVTLLVALICQYTNKKREDIPAWLTPIYQRWQAGDVVYYTNSTNFILFQHYLNEPYYVRPYHGDIMSITDEDQAAFGTPTLDFWNLPAKGYRRAWAVITRNPFTKQDEADYLDNIFKYYTYQTIVNDRSAISVDQIFLIDLRSGKQSEKWSRPLAAAGGASTLTPLWNRDYATH